MPVELERHGHVAVLTLSRPEALNALSPGMLDDIDAHLDTVEADAELRTVVITGAGEKAFTAGADIGHMKTATALEAREFARRGHAVLGRIESFPSPVIAAVNGYALGGGCELALACDIRLMSETASMGLPEVTLGIFPGWGGTQRLVQLTSPGFAKELIFTGRRVGADEALRSGLANRVLPPSVLLAGAIEFAESIAERPTWAIAQAKDLVNMAQSAPAQANLAYEIDLFALAFTTDDQREGMAAFFEKRPPRFSR